MCLPPTLQRPRWRTPGRGAPMTHRDYGDEFGRLSRSNVHITATSRRQVMSALNLDKVGRVCVTVADTDRAIDFYVDKLGFTKVVDEPMGEDMRWVEVALPNAQTTIAIAPPPPGTPAGG